MNSGRPIFSQEEAVETDETSVAVASAQAAEERKKVDPIGNRLKFSENWADTPYIPHQARVYPDTVKVVSERYRSFPVNDEAAMALFSEIKLSDSAGGRYRITLSEREQWVEKDATWHVLIRYQERMFKTIHTTQSNPEEP